MNQCSKATTFRTIAALAACASLVFTSCEINDTKTFTVRLISPRSGESVGYSPVFAWRIETYTPGETYHVLVRTDLGTEPLDDYYTDEFDTGWHSGQTQQARVRLQESKYRYAKVWWSIRVWDSTGTEYFCRDENRWFHVADDR